jgi:asparagine synthase (glutamine-hydrolysing)
VDLDWGYIPNSAEERSSASLACGVECRFPLLDKELVEYVFALPRHMKARDGWRRYIARRSMEGLLPPEVQWRKRKVGPGSIPYGKAQIVNNLNAIEEFLLKKEKDPFLMQYLNGKTLAKALALAKRGDFLSGQMTQGIVRQGVALALFLETVEK